MAAAVSCINYVAIFHNYPLPLLPLQPSDEKPFKNAPARLSSVGVN